MSLGFGFGWLKIVEDVRIARETLDLFMREQIGIKKGEIRRGKVGGQELDGGDSEKTRSEAGMKGLDVFTRLTRANEEEESPEKGLTDDELVRSFSPWIEIGLTQDSIR